MTTANKITILRILLIPLFVFLMLDYIHDYTPEAPRHWQRMFACAVFAAATISDGLDGYIARRYKQKSELGTVLDPLADKALLVSAMILLSFNTHGAFDKLPLWFLILVISRDVLLVVGSVLIHILTGKMTVRPRIVGKIATVFQMLSLGWILLKIDVPNYMFFVYGAGFFTFVSGIWYIFDGLNQLNVHHTGQPKPGSS